MTENVRPLGPLCFPKGAVTLGDPSGAHVRLSGKGLEALARTEPLAFIDWESVDSLLLDVPQTTARFVPLAWDLLTAVITLASTQPPDFDAESNGSLTVVAQGTHQRFSLSPYRQGKYWAKDVARVQAFLDSLVAAPARRDLLSRAGAELREIVASVSAAS